MARVKGNWTARGKVTPFIDNKRHFLVGIWSNWVGVIGKKKNWQENVWLSE